MNPDRLINLKTISKLHGTDTEMLSCILDAVNSGIVILDQEERIVFLNSKAQQLLRIDPAIMKGRHLSRLFLQDDREILVPNILEIVRQDGEFEGEFMLQRGDMESFMAFFSAYYWRQEGESFYIISFNDISRLKGIEKILKRSEHMVYLGRMLDDISHQIRNPVLAIGGFSRRLLKTKLERPEYAKIILEESRRLEMLLDVLTDFIRIPKPRFSVTTYRAVKKSINGYSSQIAGQFDVDLRIEESCKDLETIVVTDNNLFRQALEPVLINACEAFLDSDRRPVVTLRFTVPATESGGMMVEVSDLGHGIRPPLLPRIFHPFFSTKTGHLGMGLTFTKRIIEELEGHVEVSSKLNQGTVVRISLPGDRRRTIRTRPIKLSEIRNKREKKGEGECMGDCAKTGP